MTAKPEAYTFSLDEQNPHASTMRVDVVPTRESLGPFSVTIHTSAAQATVRHPSLGRVHPEDLAFLVAIARCAFAEGRAAAGGDPSEVMVTEVKIDPPDDGDPGVLNLPGRYLGAVAWLHYTDDAGRLQCGTKAARIAGFHGAANVVAAIIEGAAVCPRCAEMHRAEAEAVKTGARRVE